MPSNRKCEMHEKEPQRRSPILEVEIGGIALKLTYMNTTLFSFANMYDDQDHSHMNHIWVMEGEDTFCAYDSPELFETLDEAGYPHVRMPYPNEAEIEMYVSYQVEGMDDEEL